MSAFFKVLVILLFALVAPANARCLEGITGPELVKEHHYDLSRKTVVITGGDSGIGAATSLSIAMTNAKVIFLGHDMDKTAKWMQHIIKVTGNGKLSAIPVNQMSLASVKDAAEELIAKHEQIDVVIGNAGTDSESVFRTVDGYNSAFELQYLSHFYLVELLLPLLRKSKGRVIYTSGIGLNPFGPPGFGSSLCQGSGMEAGCWSIENLERTIHNVSHGEGWPAIQLSYYAKAMHARMISLWEKDVMAFAFQPGAVFSPGLAASMTTKDVKELCQSLPYVNCLCGINISCPLNIMQSAPSPVYLAVAPAHELAQGNGAESVQCGWSPPGMDPFGGMVYKLGKHAVVAYLQQLKAASEAWVKKAGVMKAASAEVKLGVEANARPKVSVVVFTGALLGLLACWANKRFTAADKYKSGSEYMYLAGA